MKTINTIKPSASTYAEPAVGKRSRTRAGALPYRTLDAWRGFASLWVVMFHICEILVQRTPALAVNPIYWFGLQGSLGVQLFFVISGYCILSAACSAVRANDVPQPLPESEAATSVQSSVMASEARSTDSTHILLRFLRARVRRIYPPFWWALLLTIASSMLAQRLIARGILRESVLAGKLPHDPLYYLSNALLGQIGVGQPCLLGPSWSLCYEVAFYLIIGLIVGLSLRRSNRVPLQGVNDSEKNSNISLEGRMLGATHIITLLVMAMLLLAPERLCYPLDLWISFGLGALVYDGVRLRSASQQKNEQEARGFAAKLMLGTLTVGLLGFCVRYVVPVGYLGNGGRWPFMVALIFSMVLWITHRYDVRIAAMPPVRALAWVGQFSYSLYLTHVLVIGPATQLIKRLHVSENANLIVLMLVMVISILLARIFYQFCELPFVKSNRASKRIDQVGSGQ